MNPIVENLKTDLSAIKNTQTKDYSSTGFYVFVSFDLKNSTAFKSVKENKKWPQVFSAFIEDCKNIMKKNFDSSYEILEWKCLGDELLFYFPFPKFDSLVDIPRKCFTVVNEINKKISKNIEEEKMKGKLEAKCTIWAANVDELDSLSPQMEYRNILSSPSINQRTAKDFFGKDIDTGFRISKFSEPYAICLDINFAWLIRNKNEKDHCKIVSFEKLKGVWNDKSYPIIWYNPDWATIANYFEYDEYLTSPIKARIYSELDKLKDISHLENVIEKNEHTGYLTSLEEKVKISENKEIKTQISDRWCEIHLVAVCINSDNKVLIFKRIEDSSSMSGKWEFGCAFLKANSTFQDSISSCYRDWCGIDITFDDATMPFTYFMYQKEGRIIPGYRYKISVDSSSIPENFDKNRYSEARWVSKDEALGFSDSETIPEFNDTVKKVFSEN